MSRATHTTLWGAAGAVSVVSAGLLAACGGSALESGAGGSSAGSSNPNGGSGAVDVGNGRAGALGVAGAVGNSGAAGQANEEPELPEPGIAGRWAMFGFEDPVGVQLLQAGSTLTGGGCAAGAPPLADTDCGSLSGSVHGRRASFSFQFLSTLEYGADVTVSADGTRMTGPFRGLGGSTVATTAWLRVADDQPYLADPLPDLPEESGTYELRLLRADAGATEYVPDTVYSLSYFDRGLSGDLGAFWVTELSRAAPGGPIQVGPVAPTTPELPIAMSIEVHDKRLTQVTAVTAAGDTFTFSAMLPASPPTP
jgi:hypothetical protein